MLGSLLDDEPPFRPGKRMQFNNVSGEHLHTGRRRVPPRSGLYLPDRAGKVERDDSPSGRRTGYVIPHRTQAFVRQRDQLVGKRHLEVADGLDRPEFTSRSTLRTYGDAHTISHDPLLIAAGVGKAEPTSARPFSRRADPTLREPTLTGLDRGSPTARNSRSPKSRPNPKAYSGDLLRAISPSRAAGGPSGLGRRQGSAAPPRTVGVSAGPTAADTGSVRSSQTQVSLVADDFVGACLSGGVGPSRRVAQVGVSQGIGGAVPTDAQRALLSIAPTDVKRMMLTRSQRLCEDIADPIYG